MDLSFSNVQHVEEKHFNLVPREIISYMPEKLIAIVRELLTKRTTEISTKERAKLLLLVKKGCEDYDKKVLQIRKNHHKTDRFLLPRTHIECWKAFDKLIHSYASKEAVTHSLFQIDLYEEWLHDPERKTDCIFLHRKIPLAIVSRGGVYCFSQFIKFENMGLDNHKYTGSPSGYMRYINKDIPIDLMYSCILRQLIIYIAVYLSREKRNKQ